eukprot:COSAG01_NODE_7373_length_3232_cov_4.371360_5_plen_249_part_00
MSPHSHDMLVRQASARRALTYVVNTVLPIVEHDNMRSASEVTTGVTCAADDERPWETKAAYDQFLQDVLNYSDPRRRAIDNPETRINADRHDGLRQSVDQQLVHGNKILHNDSVHLKRNLKKAMKNRGNNYHDNTEAANRLLDELMACVDEGQVQSRWEAIKDFDEAMYEYLRGCQPEWWIEAYFVTVMDGCKTTSNAAEQENNRFKTQGIRWMAPLDFLDAVCRLVTTVAQAYVWNAWLRSICAPLQ